MSLIGTLLSWLRLRTAFASTSSFVLRAILVFLFLSLFGVPRALHAQKSWPAIGPDGGDARSFAAVVGDSRHLYLGSTTGWVFESRDGGASWTRLSRLDGLADNLVVDHLLVDPVDPQTVYAAAWTLHRNGGGLWISRDGARHWREIPALHGQSIRSFAMAPSAPRILFAGALDGVYRSEDSGATWKLISPAGSKDIHEIESLAIDPQDPKIIYAGTWHLPWKSADGGGEWRNIKQGVIDDSDVFSIIIDPVQPKNVYLSACSGIYRSEDAGLSFHKIQGIPATARRTRVLKQDPVHREVIYAGTTEGLYKSENSGQSFRRMTGPTVIVNDIFIDPVHTNRLLLATDRGGVQLSNDGGATFMEANRGFSARMVEAVLVDRFDAHRIYAGVVNDKSYGSVFTSTNGDADWSHIGNGLNENDVFALAQADTGEILAGTNHGIFALEPGAGAHAASFWRPKSLIANTRQATAASRASGQRVALAKTVKEPLWNFNGRVSALDLSGEVWAAASSVGVLTSRDHGASWRISGVPGGEYVAVAVHGATVYAARTDLLAVSENGGESWRVAERPEAATKLQSLLFAGDGSLWLGTREGIFISRDEGRNWFQSSYLPLLSIDDLYYDAGSDRVLASSRFSSQVYVIDPKTYRMKQWSAGYRIRSVRVVDGRILAASLYDGLLAGPLLQDEVSRAK